MAGTAAAWPLYEAIAAAMLADGTVAAMLTAPDKVFNLRAPVGTDGDYVVLGGISESEYWMFHKGGSEAVVTCHLWMKGNDAAKAAKLYGEMHRVLNLTNVPLAGFRSMIGTLALVDIQSDPDGKYAHGIVRYSVTALRS